MSLLGVSGTHSSVLLRSQVKYPLNKHWCEPRCSPARGSDRRTAPLCGTPICSCQHRRMRQGTTMMVEICAGVVAAAALDHFSWLPKSVTSAIDRDSVSAGRRSLSLVYPLSCFRLCWLGVGYAYSQTKLSWCVRKGESKLASGQTSLQKLCASWTRWQL